MAGQGNPESERPGGDAARADAPRSAFQFQIWHVLVLTGGGAILFWLTRNVEVMAAACPLVFVLITLSF
jgi:hypothetical protein